MGEAMEKEDELTYSLQVGEIISDHFDRIAKIEAIDDDGKITFKCGDHIVDHDWTYSDIVENIKSGKMKRIMPDWAREWEKRLE